MGKLCSQEIISLVALMVAVSHGAVYVLPSPYRCLGTEGTRGSCKECKSVSTYLTTLTAISPSTLSLVSSLDPTQHNRWLLRQRQRRCSKQSLVILGRIGKSWEVSQSLLVILKMHFIGSFAITVLPQVVARARTTLSPLFL